MLYYILVNNNHINKQVYVYLRRTKGLFFSLFVMFVCLPISFVSFVCLSLCYHLFAYLFYIVLFWMVKISKTVLAAERAKMTTFAKSM